MASKFQPLFPVADSCLHFLQPTPVTSPRSSCVHSASHQYPDLAVHLHSHSIPSSDTAAACLGTRDRVLRVSRYQPFLHVQFATIHLPATNGRSDQPSSSALSFRIGFTMASGPSRHYGFSISTSSSRSPCSMAETVRTTISQKDCPFCSLQPCPLQSSEYGKLCESHHPGRRTSSATESYTASPTPSSS